VKRTHRALGACAIAGVTLATLAAGMSSASAEPSTNVLVSRPAATAPAGITKIKHIVMIMQENRSFDEYFGTYPGANGIQMNDGKPVACLPYKGHLCMRPYHDPRDVNGGGPHGRLNALADIDKGKMDGYINQTVGAGKGCLDPKNPICSKDHRPDVMGWHDAREIPNYWKYAQNYVLQDAMFQPDASWSLPAHLFQVSAWSATCQTRNVPSSCVNNDFSPGVPWRYDPATKTYGPIYAWTDETYLLHKAGVSWRYYVTKGGEPDCADDEAVSCAAVPQSSTTLGIWNPLPGFDDVRQDGQLGNIQDVSNYYTAAKQGTLPSVTWIVPNADNSEHPPASVKAGQAFVTGLVNAAMSGPDWDSTAVFVSWDDWGGFYDHVKPPTVDQNGYGLRVPGLVISPYAKQGYIDHQTLSFDAYLKFIEDRFLGGQRLDPATDGRPDPRPLVRENVKILGDLSKDFNFNQTPRKPTLLPLHPAPGPASQ
jgi:phospholipase C